MIDAYASEYHYLDHLAPVWQALPESERGTFCVATEALRVRADAYGIDGTLAGFLSQAPTLTLVAAWRDFKWINENRPLVLLEHGAGQTYTGDETGREHPGYAGGSMRERVAVFLTPREEVAARNRARYPQALHAVVGCPKLDAWMTGEKIRMETEQPVTFVSAHFDQGPVPECHSSWWEYRLAVRHMAARTPVVRHAHPRALVEILNDPVTLEIPLVSDFNDVLAAAAVYVCDNSSTMYEAAAIGIPVVAYNGKHYRRGINHGLRFWDLIPGPQADSPGELHATVEETLRDRELWSSFGRNVATHVYDVLDGTSSQRAAEACLARVA